MFHHAILFSLVTSVNHLYQTFEFKQKDFCQNQIYIYIYIYVNFEQFSEF